MTASTKKAAPIPAEVEKLANDLLAIANEDGPTHWRPLPPPPSQDREPDSQRGAK